MLKNIHFALSKVPTTPSSLRKIPSVNAPKTEVAIDLAKLFHNYFLDKHGRQPPNPDPAQFEHLQYLTSERDFRIRGNGLGPTSASRRTHSNELGHAFCRLFLHDHFNITYFAHIEHILRISKLVRFGNISIERHGTGDAPDYFCAESVDKVFLSEAKGRHSAISFSSAEFASWRKQFDRVLVKDASGHLRSMKGWIVATRFATEKKPNTKTTLYAEDPNTPGDQPLNADDVHVLGRRVISSHYAGIALKLSQPILAEALLQSYVVPDEIRFPATVWELRAGPLAGLRFVGGYYSPIGGALLADRIDGKIVFGRPDPFRLDVESGTFFGVEEKIFKQVTSMARSDATSFLNISRLEQIQPFYSGISILRDGSVIGPLEFFAAIDRIDF